MSTVANHLNIPTSSLRYLEMKYNKQFIIHKHFPILSVFDPVINHSKIKTCRNNKVKMFWDQTVK